MPRPSETAADREKRLARERALRSLLSSPPDESVPVSPAPRWLSPPASTPAPDATASVMDAVRSLPAQNAEIADMEAARRAAARREQLRRGAAEEALHNEGDAAQAGTIQGVSLGFADEIEAAARNALGMQRSDAPTEGTTRLRGLEHAPEEYAAERARMRSRSPS
jgi:hypothetical protein